MSLGLSNEPATFQRLMESCLGVLHLSDCIICLDDIHIFFKTSLGTHSQAEESFWRKLLEAGLKLKPSNCDFFYTRLSYLGHIVSEDGIETDPKKVEANKIWPTPTTVTEVICFLGFTKYYWWFIHRYANIAKPLNLLTAGEISFQKLKEFFCSTPFGLHGLFQTF